MEATETPGGAPLAFALYGASAHEQAHSRAAFSLALRLGAEGLAARVWISSERTLVLSDDGRIRRGLRRRRIRELTDAELPDDVMSLGELVEESHGARLMLDVDDEAFGDTIALLKELDLPSEPTVLERAWFTHADLEVLRSWRQSHPELRLVHTTALARLKLGPERHAADLAASAIDAVALPCSEWSTGLVTLFHRFERLTVSSDPVHGRIFDEVLSTGIDALSTAHVDRFVDAVGRLSPARRPRHRP
jgi:hypothetical protein